MQRGPTALTVPSPKSKSLTFQFSHLSTPSARSSPRLPTGLRHAGMTSLALMTSLRATTSAVMGVRYWSTPGWRSKHCWFTLEGRHDNYRSTPGSRLPPAPAYPGQASRSPHRSCRAHAHRRQRWRAHRVVRRCHSLPLLSGLVGSTTPSA